MFHMLFSQGPALDAGLFIIRVGIGAVFMIFGGIKLYQGPQEWLWLGSQLKYVGITLLPTMWGFLESNIEFFGGICLLVGFATRPAALLLAIAMVVAFIYHINNHDAWSVYAFSLSLFIVMVGICIAGPGRYSLDAYLHHQ